MSGSPTTAELVQVLEYMDGPQALLLSRGEDTKIVAVAANQNVIGEEFFGAEISGDQWARYRRGLVDFRYLFMYPKRKKWYFFGLNGDLSKIALTFTERTEQAEVKYIPEAGFFSYDHSEKIVDDTVKSLSLQKYSTDGVWEFFDFTSFYNKLSDLYAFFLSLKKYHDPSLTADHRKKIRESFAEQPLRGGSSYVNMYSGFASVQQLGDRLSIGKWRYASPGEFDVRGRFDIFEEIAISLAEFSDQYAGLKVQYDSLHNYLSANKLLRNDAGYYDNDGPVAKFIMNKADCLFDAMKVQDKNLILELTTKNALLYGKISLSHFRRLEKYFMFFAEGRVKDPETVKGIEASET